MESYKFGSINSVPILNQNGKALSSLVDVEICSDVQSNLKQIVFQL